MTMSTHQLFRQADVGSAQSKYYRERLIKLLIAVLAAVLNANACDLSQSSETVVLLSADPIDAAEAILSILGSQIANGESTILVSNIDSHYLLC
jgi:hypothetical protein